MAADADTADIAPDVDEVVWLAPEDAEALLSYGTDRDVLDRARAYL